MNKGLWEFASNLIVAIVPVFMAVAIGFGSWVTAEVYESKYSSLNMGDGRRIEAAAEQYTDNKFSLLLSEINRLRESVDKLQYVQAETLAEVRMLKSRE